MLTRDEEIRVGSCIDVIKHDIDGTRHPSFNSPGLDFKTQLWLAEKLKVEHDENVSATDVIIGLQKTNLVLNREVTRLEEEVKRLETREKALMQALNEFQEVATGRSSIEELTKPKYQFSKELNFFRCNTCSKVKATEDAMIAHVREHNECNCVGIDHENKCKYWELPL